MNAWSQASAAVYMSFSLFWDVTPLRQFWQYLVGPIVKDQQSLDH